MLEALLSTGGALDSDDGRRVLGSAGLEGALSRAMAASPHGEVSNRHDDLPERYAPSAGGGSNVVRAASRAMSLLKGRER